MMFTKPIARRAAAAATVAAALTVLGTAGAHADGWPPLQDGARLYTGTHGTGTATSLDLSEFGTCHTLAVPAGSVQVVSGSASVVLYAATDCTGAYPWATGSLAQSDTPWTMRSYRIVPA
ncbi:hypothetical protein [Streptomyces sp. NPDC048111]|uniref:hypothetical protein n=1 Tax=Streptomyces sp. NPDC048111 TaxID=3365500 RepID=UPI003710DF0D